MEEKLKVLQSEKGELNLSGLKILGTGKTYDINSTFCKSRKLNALKEVKKSLKKSLCEFNNQ